MSVSKEVLEAVLREEYERNGGSRDNTLQPGYDFWGLFELATKRSPEFHQYIIGRDERFIQRGTARAIETLVHKIEEVTGLRLEIDPKNPQK